MTFFDSSALIPVFVEGHVHEHRSRETFHATPVTARACCQHSLAECFNTLTKHSTPDRATPDQARAFLQYLRSNARIVKLTTDDYFHAIDVLTGLNLSGPMIYDALLLQAARKINAEIIYTWNVKHFQRLAPDLAGRIRTP